MLSRLKSTAEMGSLCAGSTRRHSPVFTVHNLTLSSNWGWKDQVQADTATLSAKLTEPDTMRLDWGLKLTQKT